MSNPDNDLDKTFEDLKAQLKFVNERAELYKTKAEKSAKQAEEAEQKAKLAEKLAREADENYKKALELKSGEYQQLIHDLFETPQKELINHMKAHSKNSLYWTMGTAIISIIFGWLISTYFQNQSSNSTNDLIAKMEVSQKTTNDLLNKIDSVNESIWAADTSVKNIVKIIENGKKDFKDYQSKNDLILMFKVKMSKDTPDAKYTDYLKAFNVSKVNKEIIPRNEDELRRWDAEYLELCKKAISSIEFKINLSKMSLPYNPYKNLNNAINTNNTNSNSSRSMSNSNTSLSDTIITDEKEKRFATYKSENDDTNYESWGWNIENFTYQSLLNKFKDELQAVEKRMASNK